MVSAQRAWLGSSGIRKLFRNAIKPFPVLPTLPNCSELVHSYALASGQKNGLKADLQHFELLGHLLSRRYMSVGPNAELVERDLPPSVITQRTSGIQDGLDFPSRFSSRLTLLTGLTEGSAVDSGELITRYILASIIRKSGDLALAAAENAKILCLDPDHIPARMLRAVEAIERRKFGEAQRDLFAVLNHPDLIGYIRKDPTLLRFFHQASRQLAIGGKAQEGQILARKTLDLAICLNSLQSESHYNLAQAYATLAQNDPAFVAQAAAELWWVLVANPSNQINYLQDSAFDPVREQIDAVLRRKPDPTAEHQRLLAMSQAQSH